MDKSGQIQVDSKVSKVLEQDHRPVDDGTHVQADVVEGAHEALLHCAQVGRVVVDVDHLHAALEGALQRPRGRLQEVP